MTSTVLESKLRSLTASDLNNRSTSGIAFCACSIPFSVSSSRATPGVEQTTPSTFETASPCRINTKLFLDLVLSLSSANDPITTCSPVA